MDCAGQTKILHVRTVPGTLLNWQVAKATPRLAQCLAELLKGPMCLAAGRLNDSLYIEALLRSPTRFARRMALYIPTSIYTILCCVLLSMKYFHIFHSHFLVLSCIAQPVDSHLNIPIQTSQLLKIYSNEMYIIEVIKLLNNVYKFKYLNKTVTVDANS